MPPGVYEALRVALAVAGGLAAFFIVGPLVRGLVYVVSRKTMPQSLQVLARAAGAVAAGLIIYFTFTLGPGWGPGGGGSGTGNGTGDDKGPGVNGTDKSLDKKRDDKATTDKTAPDKKHPASPGDWLVIEVIGGQRYPGEGKYYLLHRKEPPVVLEDVETHLQQNKQKLKEVHIIQTGDSHSGAVTQLERKLATLLRDPSYVFVPRVLDERKK